MSLNAILHAEIGVISSSIALNRRVSVLPLHCHYFIKDCHNHTNDLFSKSHLILQKKCWDHKGSWEFPGISFVSNFSIQCPSFPLHLAREIIQRMIAQTITGTEAPKPEFGWDWALNNCSPDRLCSASPSLMGGLYIWLWLFQILLCASSTASKNLEGSVPEESERWHTALQTSLHRGSINTCFQSPNVCPHLSYM